TTVNGFTFYDLTRVVFPDGTDERFTYDPKGNVASRTDRAGVTWQFAYNLRGQLLSANIPTGGVASFTYNADGTMASLQMPNTGPIAFTYDALKRSTSRSHADASTHAWTGA